MSTHRSMANVLLDGGIQTPLTSSPLRRKSVLPQKLICSQNLSENNDKEERLARRREINEISASVSNVNTSDKRRSLGLSFLVDMPISQMTERISQCIKLGTENKINPKNAFSLEMIDFMTYMIRKKDVNMSNLQVASTSLDVSTKIYGFRVDGVHMDILKMMGGLDKQEKNNEIENNSAEQMSGQEENTDNKLEQQEKKKKKKKNKQLIFNTVEALKMNVDTEKPSVITLEADLQTTDMLYQATLPNHANSRFYQHSYNDILVDVIESKDIQNIDVDCNFPVMGNFPHLEICPPLLYFDFLSWNVDNEPDEMESEEDDESRFQFDPYANLTDNDEGGLTSMCYFDSEENEEENVDRCAKMQNEVENIVDFRKVLTTSTISVSEKISEYSYIQKNFNVHWAGPSHWKVNSFRKGVSNNRIIETCRQAPVKKKKEIELCYDDKPTENVINKFLSSQAITLHARTAKVEWNDKILPPDEHYDITRMNKFYFYLTLKYLENMNEMNTTHLSDTGENYNYDNENHISNNCPHIFNEECQVTRPEEENMVESQMMLTGDNLVSIPKLTNKVPITYCVRAKKIDMRQLKLSIWDCLTANNKKDESIQSVKTKDKINDRKYFSKIYKTLPNKLTKTNIEALSFPISFVSLLHIANEKTLRVTSTSDMADLIVEQD